MSLDLRCVTHGTPLVHDACEVCRNDAIEQSKAMVQGLVDRSVHGFYYQTPNGYQRQVLVDGVVRERCHDQDDETGIPTEIEGQVQALIAAYQATCQCLECHRKRAKEILE